MKLNERQMQMLRQYREAKGWTQAEAASETGVPVFIIGTLERDGAAHAKNVRKLVDGLGIDDRTFYGLEAAK